MIAFAVVIIIVFLLNDTHISSLSTSSRWIVNAKTGKRVKLACVNWPAHMYPMIPEGLHKKPLKNITESIVQMGFNCVRITWATQMFTHDSYRKLTVTESLNKWGLVAAKSGMNISNPQLMNLTLIDAQKAVIDALGEENIMVVLDNHVSLPGWCCDWNDGNGFFKDEHFDPKEWLQGLSLVSKQYRGNPTVVAVSIRNELRGPRQNENEWRQYMEEGATAVHQENLDVLVIVSGLTFESDLSFLKRQSLNLAANMNKKLVYEAHWYAFGNPSEKWIFQTNEFCADITKWFVNQTGYLLTGKNPTPIFISEFGKDQRGVNEAENRYFACLMAFLAERDLEWALWGLQGSYMLREGQLELEEPYGMYDFSWDNIRNSSVLQNLQLVQRMIRDPTSYHKTYYLMYHPQTGRCVHVGKHNITTSDCYKLNRWGYNGVGGPIRLLGTSRCLTVEGDDRPANVTEDCSSQKSVWRFVSKSRMHLTAKDGQGRDLCLEWDSFNSTIVTKKCLCLGDNLQDNSWCSENPQRQWFKLVQTNI